MSYKQAVINNTTLSTTVICIHVFDSLKTIDSLESFVQESDYTGCAVCISFIKRNRIIRVSCLGTTIHRLICMFLIRLSRVIFVRESDYALCFWFTIVKWLCREFLWELYCAVCFSSRRVICLEIRLSTLLVALYTVHICVCWMLYVAYVCH